MSGGVEKNNNNGLLVVLIALSLLSVILVATIVVIHLPKPNPEMGNNSVLPDELKDNNLSKPDQVVKDVTLMLNNPQYNNDDIVSYYNTEIREALDNNDSMLAIEIIIQKINYYATIMQDCAAIKNDVGSIDLSPYSKEEKMYLASRVASVAIDCEDDELREKWENLYQEERSKNE